VPKESKTKESKSNQISCCASRHGCALGSDAGCRAVRMLGNGCRCVQKLQRLCASFHVLGDVWSLQRRTGFEVPTLRRSSLYWPILKPLRMRSALITPSASAYSQKPNPCRRTQQAHESVCDAVSGSSRERLGGVCCKRSEPVDGGWAERDSGLLRLSERVKEDLGRRRSKRREDSVWRFFRWVCLCM
jgi:hypothetical protein